MKHSAESHPKAIRTSVIVLDIHPAEDSRVNRHITFLLKNGYVVYRVHINRFYPNLQEGPFSNHGEKGYRINLFDTTHSRKNSILYNISAFTPILRREIRKALKTLDWKEEDSSIIHVHDPSLLLAAKKMIRTCKNATLVYDRHEVYENGKRHAGITFPSIEMTYEVLATKAVRGVVTVSEGYIPSCKAIFPHAIIKAVPNFPDASEYDIQVINDKIESFSVDSPIDLVYFGSLDYHYDRDIALILKISDRILTNNPSTHVYIGGKTEDQTLINDFTRLSEKYPGRFHFMGFLPREDVVRITEKAHIGFCLLKPDTSYWVRISPNKVFEYLVCGTVPIIRADVDYAGIFSRCSMIFERYAPEDEIISAIGSLIRQPEKMREMMKECLSLRKNFLYETVATQYIQIYQDVLTPTVSSSERLP
jgi:glycosyltransferase involved in cell wall biosynthesis